MNSGHILLLILVIWVLTALLGDTNKKKYIDNGFKKLKYVPVK